MENFADKFKYLIGFLFIGFLVFALVEFRAVNEIYLLDSYLFKNYTVLFIILAILTISFFHYAAPEFRPIFTGEDTYWLSRFKLAGRILITFPGLVLAFHLITKSTISLINRKVGPQKEVNINGRIVDKYESTSKTGTRYYITVKNNTLDEPINVKVDHDYYLTAKPGESYSIDVKEGYLGYLYK